MRFRRLILLFAGVLFAYHGSAQMKGEYVQSRILILLDESSSMVQTWTSGKEKYKAAHDLIMHLMDSVYAVNPDVQFGLRVFGHQSTVPEHNCYDTKNEVPFAYDNRNQMRLRLEDIHPLGVTPIAFALTEAANKDIIDEARNAYSLILITDGGESCGGDLCMVMTKLLKNKVFFKPYIVSLENDPTLKSTYSCMGDFLQVTTESDIPRAVSTIVDAFRPQLKIVQTEYQQIQTTNVPSVLKVNIPPIKKTPAIDELRTVAPADMRLMAQSERPIVAPPLLSTNVHLPPLTAEAPPPLPKTERVSGIMYGSLKQLAIATPAQGKVKSIKEMPPLPPLAVDTPARPKAEKVAKLKPAGMRQMNVIFVIEEHSYPQLRLSSLPPLKPDPVRTPAKPEPSTPKKQEFVVKVEESKETTLEVYFTNGMGKYYNSTPQMLLLDPKTKKVVSKFFRFVDDAGNPDPQKGIAPGTYDLTFANNTATVLEGVVIEVNKKNKVTITVKNTSLSFQYRDDPNTPITEAWVANVTERNKTMGRVEDQRMSQKIMYEPGNYHIEINTFPRDIRNVDLDVFSESVITIPHPGFAKFVSDGKSKGLVLYQRLGDKFTAFAPIDLNDPRSQHLQIQPGEYQAHYQRGPGQASASEKVKVFKIRSKEETVITLD